MIVAISEARMHFFGGPGQMLLPGVATVAAQLQTIPKQQLLTTRQLRERLAMQFGVRGVCPVTLQKALLAIAKDPQIVKDPPFWRVIKPNGTLFNLSNAQAELLRGEGFVLEPCEKTLRVIGFRESLVRDDS
jgi:hypothetical protein